MRIFRNHEGKLRTGWRMGMGAAAYVAAFYGVLNGLAAVFGIFFNGWGLTTDNLRIAPFWAQQVVRWHTDFCYGAAYLVSGAVGLWLARKWNAPASEGNRRTVLGAGGLGLSMGALLTWIALAFDCMRLENPLAEPQLTAAQPVALAVLLLGQVSAEILTRRLVFDALKVRWKAYLAACIASLLLAGIRMDFFGVANVLLLGVVGCAFYERGGLWASAALNAGWTAWTALLFGFPGTTVSASPVYGLYHVSEAWLTGGNLGPDCGLGMTVVLAATTVFLFRREIGALRRSLHWGEKDAKRNQNTETPAASAGCRRHRNGA